ncbi:MAG TPA: NAD(P)-dependent oxidoreductase, partial [Acidimicrobiales bacterium]|nr:NAD(P)-dependent oxidoreductase [Acidimicrobiales bacterium]
MHVLVTGGSGFIGRHVVRQLVDAGHTVQVVDLVPFPDPEISCLVGDLRDRAIAEQAVTSDVDAVIHLAAITRVLLSIEDPDNVYLTNVAATHYLLERCRELGVLRFVLA